MTSRPRYLLMLEAVPLIRPGGPGPPPEVTVKRALKCLWQSFGLRCVSAEEVRDDGPGEGPQVGGGPRA